MRAFVGEGTRNEDFVGFGMQVYAPISGVVLKVKNPNGVNLLGAMTGSEVGFVAIKSSNGEVVLLAHLAGTMQLDPSRLLDLLAQNLRRSLVVYLDPIHASFTPRFAQESASQSLPSQLHRPGLANIQVSEGSPIRVGEPIGIISNNGSSRNPHIHLGAYRKSHSLVIEFDRDALDSTLSKVSLMEQKPSP